VNPGDKIVTLQTIDPIYVDFNLPQKAIGSLQVGQVVNVTSDGFAGESFPGKITAISPKVDTATRNVSRSRRRSPIRSASCCRACSRTPRSKPATRSTT
jgi:multidrug efflux pump subunit AcrA (membrane-fusion protein)